jgi:hypothetical protein
VPAAGVELDKPVIELKEVAASAPVEGLKVNLALVVFNGRLPVLAVTQVRYIVALVEASFVMAEFDALVAEAALPSILVIPVSVIAALLRLIATEVVPR